MPPTSLLFDLLPLMLGAALAPLWLIILLLMLQSRRGLVKAIGFGRTAILVVSVASRILSDDFNLPILLKHQ